MCFRLHRFQLILQPNRAKSLHISSVAKNCIILTSSGCSVTTRPKCGA